MHFYVKLFKQKNLIFKKNCIILIKGQHNVKKLYQYFLYRVQIFSPCKFILFSFNTAHHSKKILPVYFNIKITLAIINYTISIILLCEKLYFVFTAKKKFLKISKSSILTCKQTFVKKVPISCGFLYNLNLS